MHANSISDFRKAMRHGSYAWPGGYPLYFVCEDGESLSFAAAKAERRLILEALRDKGYRNDQWRVVDIEINWENTELYCSHTGEKIESAYGAA